MEMRMKVIAGTAALLIALIAPRTAAAQAFVSLGAAGAGTREIGFSYSGWLLSNGRTAASGAARYTFNFSEEIALEAGVDVGSAASRLFAASALQIRVMGREDHPERGKFFTVGLAHVSVPQVDSRAGLGRSIGLGVQHPVSADLALRFEGQLLIFRGRTSALRLALSIVKAKS
jgi:hypothetical protein